MRVMTVGQNKNAPNRIPPNMTPLIMTALSLKKQRLHPATNMDVLTQEGLCVNMNGIL